MDITLVNMPWASVEYPSLACAILKATVNRTGNHRARVVDANLDFFDWMHRYVAAGVRDYDFFSLESHFQGCGDWVFSSALYGDPEWRVAEFQEHRELDDERKQLCLRLHRVVPEWVERYAAELIGTLGDLVGFTTTFQQNTAALALARALKELRPDVRVVLGGANCDGEQGAAWHRDFDFVDLVVRGEGEVVLPELLDHLDRGADLTGVPGLCWRDASGLAIANPMTAAPLPPARIVAPDFDGCLERFGKSEAAAAVEPKLVVEGARGCWWGEKHHCTFCGLNGSFMQVRSKSPDRCYEELVDLVARYRIMDLYVVDNILEADADYLDVVRQMPALAHLPPMEGASRIALERFSPHFDDPSLGFALRWPDDQYALIYELPEGELHDIAYLFGTPPAGIGGEVEAALLDAVRAWTDDHARSSLSFLDRGGEVVVLGERPGFRWDERILAGRDAELFRELDRPRSLGHLRSRFGERVAGRLDEWLDDGLVFTDAGRYVHVVPGSANQELLRLA